MKKLRLALLGIVSIFCLNSCVTTALSTLAGVAVAVCGENGCNDLGDSKKSNFGGKQLFIPFILTDLIGLLK